MLTTDQKGAIAELGIAKAAVEHGIGVYLPVGDEPADMVFDIARRLWRVQCKWASVDRGVIMVRCYRARRNAHGVVRQFYSARDVDLFGAYCAELDACYLIPFADVPPSANVHLRVVATRNNQARRVRWAKEYEFAATLSRLGAVAQLGERQRGTLEATGSSPVGSTSEAASQGRLLA